MKIDLGAIPKLPAIELDLQIRLIHAAFLVASREACRIG
jgi:hypothetical protein